MFKAIFLPRSRLDQADQAPGDLQKKVGHYFKTVFVEVLGVNSLTGTSWSDPSGLFGICPLYPRVLPLSGRQNRILRELVLSLIIALVATVCAD